jgi:hypothetical protein
MNSTQLKSLKNLPIMPKLERLDLNDNFIEDGFDLIAERCIELKTLKICNNKIKDINQINFLASLQKLSSLDLSNNPVSFN